MGSSWNGALIAKQLDLACIKGAVLCVADLKKFISLPKKQPNGIWIPTRAMRPSGSLQKRLGLRRNSLPITLNAYQANGESGLKALTYKKPMPEEVRIEASRKMNEYFATRLPKNEHVGKLWFQVVVKDNRITAETRRPYFQDPSKTTTSEFFQVRYTDYDGKWHLYWKRASEKWWPYVPTRKINSIDDCLAELEADPRRCLLG